MKEKQIYPYCPECGEAIRMGDSKSCESCIDAIFQLGDEHELLKGCSICFSPLVATSIPFCSDPNCNGYSISGVAGLSLSILYKSRKVFYVEWRSRTIYFPNLRHYYSSHYKMGTGFIKELFLNIFVRFVDCDTYFNVCRFNLTRVGEL